MSSERSITRRSALLSGALVAAGCSVAAAGVAHADELAGGTEANQLVSADVLDFLYIDNAEMNAGETQNVAVALEGYSGFESATLTVFNSEAEDEISCEVSASSDSSLLFSFTPGYAGTYEVTRLVFVASGVTYDVDFSDCDASYRSFVVSYAVSTMSLDAEGASEEGPTLQVYSGDASGEAVESSSIEEGVAAALSSSVASRSRSADDGTLVIALDPGHVGVSSGAVGVNGAQEAACTWKIAQYCKAALDFYENVKVVYTVTQGEHLSSSTELEDRVQRAVDQGADVLVSLHLNSTGYGSAKGAEVYVPYNGSYNNETHAVGEVLGQKIVAELEKLGLYNRGVKIRKIDGHDGSYDYPDGSIGDYYGIIRHARKQNLPAIIVEHAFIDNASDYANYLNSDAKLRKLGEADAQGIANYYKLSMAPGTMLRLYNPNSGEHLYTQSSNEYATLGSIGWVQEGRAWVAPTSSSTPVYRLYNPNTGDHHYTLSKNEYKTLGSIGWKQEGLAWYSDDAKSVPIYRLFNPNVVVGTHHYTLSENEYNSLGKIGWVKEGVAWYGAAMS